MMKAVDDLAENEDILKRIEKFSKDDETFLGVSEDESVTLLLTKKMDGGRIRNWQKVLVEQGLVSPDDQDALEYDAERWLDDAFSNFNGKTFDQRKVEGAKLASSFLQSSWYRYYRAVRWYKERFFHHCEKQGLDICR